MYFDFGIVVSADGTEIIDRRQRTFYYQLTPPQMVEYIEIDVQLAIMDRMERKARVEAECKRKLVSNLLWKLACFCGLSGKYMEG